MPYTQTVVEEIQMDFDIRWLSLGSFTAEGLDEVVAAQQRPLAAEVPNDGRFDAMLAAHLKWAASARLAQEGDVQARPETGDPVRMSRIQAEVQLQLERIASMGVAA
jgi:hypothetical protein